MSDYRHPRSGRIYREGDPAHTYARALLDARRAAEAFLRDTDALVDADYLVAFEQRNDRAMYRLRDAMDFLMHAEQGVRLDLHRREPPDDEWRRKYGRVDPPESVEPQSRKEILRRMTGLPEDGSYGRHVHVGLSIHDDLPALRAHLERDHGVLDPDDAVAAHTAAHGPIQG